MAGKNSPQKSNFRSSPIKSPVTNNRQVSGKLPANFRQLAESKNSNNANSNVNLNVPTKGNRPRKFSLIYSSDSSLSDLSEDKIESSLVKNSISKNRKKQEHNDTSRKLVSGMFANSLKNINQKGLNKDIKKKISTKGKNSKLIRNSIDEKNSMKSHIEEEGTESSDYGVFVSADDNGDSGDSSDNSDNDDDDDDDDSDGSDTSSEDENIDFVKLSAQRKKKAMQALSALKRTTAFSLDKQNVSSSQDRPNDRINNDKKTITTEDVGEEIRNNDKIIPENNDINVNKNIIEDFHVPKLSSNSSSSDSESEKNTDDNVITNIENNVDMLSDSSLTVESESDYNIDQDEFFNAIDKDDSGDLIDVDTGIETGEDDIALLEQEEANIVKELQNDDSLSFDGSIREEGSDPEDSDKLKNKNNLTQLNNEEDDFYDDDFDIPFYEDPKFASLYYYGDGTEPKLGLSTSLPLLLNDEKLSKLRTKQAKKLERKERLQRHRLLKKHKSLRDASTPSIDNGGDEYIFGVFFHSDEDDENSNNGTLKKNLNLESPLRHLGNSKSKYRNDQNLSSDEDNNYLLLDVARMPSDDEDDEELHVESNNTNQIELTVKNLKKLSNSNHKNHMTTDTSSDGLSIELDDDDDDDDLSLTNVFIDIDDLDPDSFYFQYDDDEDDDFLADLDAMKQEGSSYSDISSDDSDIKNSDDDKTFVKDGSSRSIANGDGESTDEDDNLPLPTQKSRSLSTKAKEIVGSNVIGLRPPKLGTWETNSKPFSIIDGLSTKSLYPLIQEHQQLLEQKPHSQTPEEGETPSGIADADVDEMTLNELLNMSDLEDHDVESADVSNPQLLNISEWYSKPKVPLSAFRNKGVNSIDDDEYLIPVNSTKKFPMGYVGNERTRRKIAKMKELQKKENEKRRKIKKKKKLLRIKKELERKERAGMLKKELESSVSTPTTNFSDAISSWKNSLKSVGLDEIHALLGDDDNDPLAEHNGSNVLDLIDNDEVVLFDDKGESSSLDAKDLNILTSLTAPVDLSHLSENSASLWRRRKSMVEAAEENLRFTKSGLFSETALADIEDILEDGTSSSAFNFNEVLQ